MLDKLNYIIIGIIAAIIIFVLLLVTGVIPGLRSPVSEKCTLTVWGAFEDSGVKDAFEEISAAYKKENGACEVKYFQRDYLNYERDLVDALASGNGPDLFYIHNSWLPKHKEKISPMPQLVPGKEKNFKYMTPYDYKNKIFVDVAAQDFIDDEKIYAIPLYVDTLAVFWNKDIFNKKGVPKPPQTWEEFVEIIPKLTETDEKDNITRSAVSMGMWSDNITPKGNINRATDILAALMLQGGTEITNKENKSATFVRTVSVGGGEEISPGKQALQFYTDFANPLKKVYTWNKDMHYSLNAFSEGSVAMTINYAYNTSTIKKEASRLNFSVAPFPQPRGIAVPINYPSYWGITVASASKQQTQAWDFLMFFSREENTKKYLEASHHPTAMKDLFLWQKAIDPDLSVFIDQALSAKSWYQPNNLAVDQIFGEMIQSVVEGKDIDKVLSIAAEQVNLLFK